MINKKALYTKLWLMALFGLVAVNTLPLDQIMIAGRW